MSPRSPVFCVLAAALVACATPSVSPPDAVEGPPDTRAPVDTFPFGDCNVSAGGPPTGNNSHSVAFPPSSAPAMLARGALVAFPINVRSYDQRLWVNHVAVAPEGRCQPGAVVGARAMEDYLSDELASRPVAPGQTPALVDMDVMTVYYGLDPATPRPAPFCLGLRLGGGWRWDLRPVRSYYDTARQVAFASVPLGGERADAIALLFESPAVMGPVTLGCARSGRD